MLKSVVVTLFFLLASSSAVQAQLTWSEITTPASVNQFALGSDGSIYVVTGTTLYLSEDHGAHWKPIRSGSINYLTCDSNNAVEAGTFYSLDHGTSWASLYMGDIVQMAATNRGFYLTDNSVNLFCTHDYGQTWDTLAFQASGSLADWRGLYCGTGDRAMATQSVCSCWLLFDSSRRVYDTLRAIRIFTDGSPPRNVVFGQDGYIYAYQLGYLIRLAVNSLNWEAYDSVFQGELKSGSHFPLGSPDASTIVSVDSFGTYSSNNHGDSWNSIGAGIPASYIPSVIMSFDHNGEGYALSDGKLYQTTFFQSSVATRPNDVSPIIAYPIPCKSSLSINASDVERIEIFDVLGISRIVRDFGEPQNNPALDVSGLASGIYTLAVYSEGVRSNIRVVKE